MFFPLFLAFYFSYGSNLSYEFLKERLKNGPWIDDWTRSGVLEEPIPKDLGVYVLDGYEYIYNLDGVPFGEDYTAANIIPKQGGRVYGVLYEISEEHLKELDITEDVPKAYQRVAVDVYQLTHSIFTKCVKAWAYIGNPCYFTDKRDPGPIYMKLIVDAARQRRFPREYIEKYLNYKNVGLVECTN